MPDALPSLGVTFPPSPQSLPEAILMVFSGLIMVAVGVKALKSMVPKKAPSKPKLVPKEDAAERSDRF